MTAPFGRLLYLYVGSADFERDLAYYRDTLGARVVWNANAFGAKVAAVELAPGPLLLIADHRPAPSAIPIFEVKDLERAATRLRKSGWKPVGERFDVPDGPVYRFDDPSGNPLAILEVTRPDAMLR